MDNPCRAIRLLLAAAVLGLFPMGAIAQGGDQALKNKADALFDKGAYAEAWPLYSQLVSLSPQDHELNFKYGACTIYSGEAKATAIGYLRYAVGGPATSDLAWYFLGRAYQLDYRFDEALDAYKHFKGTADKKLLARFPVDALEQQSRNGKYLLSNLKDIEVLNKLEVPATDYFRFYDLSDIGGKIVVTPDELLTSYDRKSGERFLLYLPTDGGPIYFSSYGKDGRTGRDIYRTELLPNGSYATPRKVSGYVNTDQDEDYAVMAPDGKTFYFSSTGHNSMGGYDVFRSIYDPNMDAFGVPENMDFAVNTPADEMLYIVGPDGTQACFASNRDSRQDQVNVYRVGTTQTPLNLTVLKGMYSSEFGPVEKPVRIVVEDEVTRERVADVTTDAEGNYVLVLPKGGKYKFLVEDGRMSRAFWTTVEAPPAHEAQAFAQEIRLAQPGGGQLEVTTHFDTPLGEDVMALAMDEIRRRARLDVNAGHVVAEVPDAKTPSDDPVQQAGFDGTVTLPMAMEMARQEAAVTASLASEQKRQSRAAMELAVRNAAEAEAYAQQAADLVAQAAQTSGPAEKDRLLRQAGEAKQRSMESGDRARAAYRTGRTMDRASTQTLTRAERAESLQTRIAGAHAAKDQTALTEALKELKASLDRRKGPEAQPDASEQLRAVASQLSEESAKQMRKAGSQREDELALATRVERLATEAASAKGKKKQDLEAQLAQLREQHAALVEETKRAFAEVDRKEEEAVMARGQANLVRYLAGNRELGTGQTVTDAELAGMEERLDRIRQGNNALELASDYMPLAARSPEEREQRTFDWGAAEVLASNRMVETTRSMQPRTAGTGTTTTTIADGNTRGMATETASMTGSAINGEAGRNTVAVDSSSHSDGPVGSHEAATGVNVPTEDQTAEASTMGTASTEEQGTGNASVPTVDASEAGGDHRMERVVGAEDPGSAMPDDERAFMLANRLAELEQLRNAEKNRARRDSLDRVIAAQKEAIKAFQRGETASDPPGKEGEYPIPVPTYLDFDMAVLDEELVEEIFPGFNLALRAIQEGSGSQQEKALRTHALEMQLVDSVDAHTQRAVAYFEANPDRSEDALARIERWRRLKNEHVDRANRALADAGQEYVASETRAMEDAQLAAKATVPPPVTALGASPTPHNDAYVHIQEDIDIIYTSVMVPRSREAMEAVEEKDRELDRMAVMQSDIDSMRKELSEMLSGKEYDKLQERTDRKYDDLLIQTVELGQRTAFITRNEFKTAKDSLKVLSKAVAQRGMPSDEPLVAMARSYESTADNAMDQAKKLRKQADNARDIFERSSLYKQAYAMELGALRDMDRAQTVQNYLISGKAVPGESLAYEEVEWRMFPEAWAAADTEPVQDKEEEAATSLVQDDIGQPEEPAMAAPKVDSLALSTYLDRYYYLDAREREIVVQGQEESRYFLMKGRSIQDRADAATAQDEANAAAQLAQILAQEAETIRRGAAEGETVDRERLNLLDMRAANLRHRSDSLESVAKRLLVLADMADTQAAAWMEALPEAQSTRIMDLEQTKRRTEPILARTRPDPVTSTETVDTTSAEVVAMHGGEQEHRNGPDTLQAERATESPIVTEDVAMAGQQQPGTAPETQPYQEVVEVEPVQPEEPVQPGPRVPADPAEERLRALSNRPLEQDLFSFAGQSEVRQGPIPIDLPMPTGIVYKVQVGAFRNELPMEAFSDMTPVTGEQAGNGLVRYTAGMFTTAESAREAGVKVRERGYRDAFVVAYMDGRRVPLREAMQAERMRLAQADLAVAPAQRTAVGEDTAIPAVVPQPQTPVQPLDLTDRTVQATAEESVLAQYPSTAEELLASFKPEEGNTTYYNDPAAAPAAQVETVKGLFFTVQVGVYSKPTPLDRLFNITPLNSELTANAKIRYTTGQFNSEAQAARRRNEAVGLGVTDAFITAYLNGKRIPLRDARALLAKFGPAILAEQAGR